MYKLCANVTIWLVYDFKYHELFGNFILFVFYVCLLVAAKIYGKQVDSDLVILLCILESSWGKWGCLLLDFNSTNFIQIYVAWKDEKKLNLGLIWLSSGSHSLLSMWECGFDPCLGN